MKSLRIVSFLPAATEMVYALGLGDQLVGVTHECDFPLAARHKPVVVRPALALDRLSLREIDVAVAKRIRDGQALYQVEEDLLRRLRPDLILTQNLCQVCAPSGNEMTLALKSLQPRPQIIWMSPHSLENIFENILELGRGTGRWRQAERFIAGLRHRMEAIAGRMRVITHRPKVFCMEWVDPIYCAGHWMPEMIELAGGRDDLSRKGVDSVRMAWSDVLQYLPEILVVSPCGYNVAKALEQMPLLQSLPGWSDLPAVRLGRVYAVNANAYFARPGPRVIDGIGLLAHLFHPNVFRWDGPADALQQISLSHVSRH